MVAKAEIANVARLLGRNSASLGGLIAIARACGIGVEWPVATYLTLLAGKYLLGSICGPAMIWTVKLDLRNRRRAVVQRLLGAQRGGARRKYGRVRSTHCRRTSDQHPALQFVIARFVITLVWPNVRVVR